MSFPYSPFFDATVTISASTTTARGEITVDCQCLRIVNIGTVATFVKLGGVTVEATNNDFVLAPNEAVLISKGSNYSHLAALTASGTATVYVTPCTGGNN